MRAQPRVARSKFRRRIVTSLLVLALSTVVGAQQQPMFRSSVDVTAIDVIVVDGSGRPITDLTASDFRVRVNGRERRVVTARWIPQTANARQTATPEVIQGYSTNEGAIDGRLVIFAVDQPNLRTGAVNGMKSALDAFIDRLEPSDRMAAVAIGHGVSTPITTDRARVKTALMQMSGDLQSTEVQSDFSIAVSEAIEITSHGVPRGAGNPMFDELSIRECGARPPEQILGLSCWDLLRQDVVRISDEASDSSSRTFGSLRGLLNSLKKISGPKTLVILTEGFLVAQHGAEAAVELGDQAAAAQTTIYILKIDDYTPDARVSRRGTAPLEDKRIRRDGPELLAAVARGSVFDVMGAGDSALKQVEKEIAGYYLIGVESLPTDRDSKTHPIAVQVTRPRAIVRARTALSREETTAKQTQSDDVVAALSSPFSNAGLPLRVTTLPFRDGDGPNIQLLIHAEAGSGYTSNTKVALGYVISDVRGNIVSKSAGTATLPPATPGAPSPLFFTNGVTLPPGDYTLKFAMTEGDRVGSVDHLIHATLPEAGPGRVSDLVVGGPVDDNEPQRPAIGYDVRFGRVQGYIEAYGRDVGEWTTTYEVSADPEGPPILSVGVPGRRTGDGRMVFSKTLPVSDLAPGKYYLRAEVGARGNTKKMVSRQFRIAPVAPSVTTTAAAIFALAPRSMMLPVSNSLLAPPFARELAFGDTLERFRRTVAPAARPAFDAGSAAFVKGDNAEAQERFRAAVQPAFAGANNMAPLAYLGAVLAASGDDDQAISIWQTALTVGSGLPEVYEWLGQASMRLGRVPQARTAYAEGATKWPADPRFNRALAFVYAHLGQSRDALQAVGAYLSQRPNDVDMLHLGVEWIYRVHAGGSAASIEEAGLAHRWVDAYERGGGPNALDLRAWLRLIEGGDTASAAPPGPI
jgi:VWFA-related protein